MGAGASSPATTIAPPAAPGAAAPGEPRRRLGPKVGGQPKVAPPLRRTRPSLAPAPAEPGGRRALLPKPKLPRRAAFKPAAPGEDSPSGAASAAAAAAEAAADTDSTGGGGWNAEEALAKIKSAGVAGPRTGALPPASPASQNAGGDPAGGTPSLLFRRKALHPRQERRKHGKKKKKTCVHNRPFCSSGTVAYIATEVAFWALAGPVAALGFYRSVGHLPHLPEDQARIFLLVVFLLLYFSFFVHLTHLPEDQARISFSLFLPLVRGKVSPQQPLPRRGPALPPASKVSPQQPLPRRGPALPPPSKRKKRTQIRGPQKINQK